MPRPEGVPRPTRVAVEARASSEFPDANLAEIMAVLDRYGVQPHETEIRRVHMALLKLSEGRRDVLESGVETAKADYRDVLAYAEYPAEMALPALKADGSNAKAIDLARRADKKQYRDWLNGR